MTSGAALLRMDLSRLLTRRRVARFCGVLLAAEIAILAFLVAGTHGWIVPLSRPTTTDFVSFYAAGSLADAGTPALAYDRAAHLAAEERVTGPGVRYQYFNYPPVFLLLCAALAPLPYLVAFVLFEGATLALYLVVATRILADRSGTALVALLAFPIVFWNFGLGQNAFLTAALFGAATLLIDRRPIAAGLLFGALCWKPQLGLMVPFALAAAGRWRAFAAAGIVGRRAGLRVAGAVWRRHLARLPRSRDRLAGDVPVRPDPVRRHGQPERRGAPARRRRAARLRGAGGGNPGCRRTRRRGLASAAVAADARRGPSRPRASSRRRCRCSTI